MKEAEASERQEQLETLGDSMLAETSACPYSLARPLDLFYLPSAHTCPHCTSHNRRGCPRRRRGDTEWLWRPDALSRASGVGEDLHDAVPRTRR